MISLLAKQLIRKVARSSGFEISRFSESPFVLLASWLALHNIDLILDVGAHIGEFALALRKAGYRGRIVSFEPAKETFAMLSDNAKKDALWEVHPLALGDHDGEVTLHIAGSDGASSSVMPLSPGFPGYAGTQVVRSSRLDSFLPSIVNGSASIFLKVDVQGFEKAVLNGAAESLKQIKGIHIELSLIELVRGQELMHETVCRLISLGFSPWAFFPVFSEPRSHRMLQVDGVFFR